MGKTILLEINENGGKFEYTSTILQAELEISTVSERIDSIKSLKPNCDTTDYALAASSGALCGIIDVFLVGKPSESPLGNIADKWFAKKQGWIRRVEVNSKMNIMV